MSADRLLLYDGVCALCNRVVAFVLRRDRARRYRFASLQSPAALPYLQRHGVDPDAMDTFVLVLDPDTDRERVLVRGRAGVRVLGEMRGLLSLMRAAAWLPTPLLDWGYNLVARNRYRVFGQFDACPLPPPEHRDRFS
ncbi:MAG: DCC1-like thiol-disulfide oxidoreductase family protein [Fimbriimonadaceae bacterium]|nr:DCC1-like thiol-disulfide oxidoreductase family protein [Fimbriimonadaceae bacterium]